MVYKPKKTYSWGDGYKPNMDANIVGSVVEEIEAEYGSVTKEILLEKSRPEDSATHSLFEWDDSKAAENYRLDCSRRIIGNLRVVYTKSDDEQVPIKAFVNVSEFTDKARYRNVEVVLLEEDARENYLKRIRKELESFIQRNKHIEELADILIEEATKLKKGA